MTVSILTSVASVFISVKTIWNALMAKEITHVSLFVKKGTKTLMQKIVATSMSVL